MPKPTQEHIQFLSALWKEKVVLTMAELLNQFPDPATLPNLQNYLDDVRKCRERTSQTMMAGTPNVFSSLATMH